jgi:predicted transcriptional regulator of viral defense system
MQGVRRKGTDRPYLFDTPPDVRLAIWAGEHEGIVATRELHALGFNKAAIQLRVRRGTLHRIHNGVYAVGHLAISLRGTFRAAVLAGGDLSVLSHYSAATLDGYLTWDDRFPEITVVGPGARSRAGLRIHRARALHERDVFRNRVIPITTPARTLLDLADVLSDKELRRAVRQAQAMNLTSPRAIAAVLARAQGRRGARRLAALIADGPAPTRSELEDLVLGVIVDAGLRRPEINRRLGRVYPDLRWPRQRLTVECDSATWHDGKLASEDDALRQARLEASGERVLRVTWQQALEQPQQTIARLVAAGAPYTDPRS